MDDIGRYRIIGELGSGGMGIVYRGFDPVLGREVAIKTLKLSQLSDPAERDSLRERLSREARAAAALSHPGIVTIHDVVQQDGDHISLVMERIEGQTLAWVLANEPPLELARAFRIVKEAASALDYAHRKGIVHRDIKPANLMLDETGAVKVADFGIAKIGGSQTLTQSASGIIVGTAGYMSPEQLRGIAIDGGTDQFSLAVVAYEMLSRRRPFMADSLIALTHQVVFEEAPPLSAVRPGFGPGVDSVFQMALSKSPADRFSSCSEFASALESQVNAALRESTATFATNPPPIPPPVPVALPTPIPITATAPQVVRRRGWAAPVFTLLAILAVGAAGAYYYFQRNSPAAPQEVAASPQTPAENPPPADPPAKAASAAPAAPRTPAKAPATAAVIIKAGTVRVNKKDGQKYVMIPGGTFTMGCVPDDTECGEFSKPAHKVTLTAAFWMAQTDTTVAAYLAYAKEAQAEVPKTPKFNPNWSNTDHPIVEVNWDEASAYCARVNGRLPTEAEWEYAARGGRSNTLFPWGNDASHDLANFGRGTKASDEEGAIEGKDQWLFTSPVASFAPNRFQLYDMAGNVSQWCSDWFSPTYYGKSPEKDPQGPDTGKLRIARGGSWKSASKFTHTSFRGARSPQDRGITSGFRCVVNYLP